MPTPFGPQLLGETEKTLNALLGRVLGGRLTEPEWVTLRIAHQPGPAGSDELVARVADRARFDDAGALVARLTARGLIQEGRLTGEGRRLVEELQAEITATTRPIWQDLPEHEVAATTRLLHEVLARARLVLGSGQR